MPLYPPPSAGGGLPTGWTQNGEDVSTNGGDLTLAGGDLDADRIDAVGGHFTSMTLAGGDLSTGGGMVRTEDGGVMLGAGDLTGSGGSVGLADQAFVDLASAGLATLGLSGSAASLYGGSAAGASVHLGSWNNVDAIQISDFDGAGTMRIGVFGATPAARPEVPATPDAQDVVDALVALGWITQAAP